MTKIYLQSKFIYIYSILIIISFYILNYYYPFMHDDYAYCFFFDQNSHIIRPTSIRINSFKEVLLSQWNHYHFVNGRLFSHILVQSFASILGKHFFNLLNSVVALIFCCSFSKLITKKYTSIFTCIAFPILLRGLPYPGQTLYWMTGSINYFWGTTFSLVLLIHIIFYGNNTKSIYKTFLWVIISLSIGCFNESINIPVASSLFLYLLLNHKKISLHNKCIITAYCLGCTIIIFSPGTFERLNTSGNINTTISILPFFFQRFWNMSYFFITHILFFILIIIVIVYWIKKRDVIYSNESLLLYTLGTGTLFLWLLNNWEERICFFYCTVLWILFFCIIYHAIDKNKIYVTYTSLFFSIIFSIYGFQQAYTSISSFNKYNNHIVSKIKASPSDCILPHYDYPKKVDSNIYLTELSPNPANYHNRVMAFFYNKNSICFLPKEIYHTIYSKQKIYVEKRLNDSISCFNINNKYILYTYNKVPPILNIEYKLKNPTYNTLSSKQIIIRKLLGTYNDSPYIIEKQEISPIIIENKKSIFFLPYNNYEYVTIN